MNKVFKVIWSEARNAYVVVSEIAKNHGSKSCSTKKLLAMLIATGVMTCASMAPAMAADPPAEALKHSTVAAGYNITVTQKDNSDGGKEYNVDLKNDIYLAGDDPNALVSISGSKGTIWATGSVTVGSGVDGSVVMDGTSATVSGLGNKTTAYDEFANGKGKAATEEQLKEVATEAGKHTTVTAGDNVTVTEDTNKDGGKEYKVALKPDISLDSVTTGDTVMNNDGLKVGDKVSVTKDAVTAGQTSISNDGVKVGDKTYISDKGLNANDQKVTNVAAGELSATSKDAVNGSQLYATNQEVANNTNRINQLGSRVNKVGAGAAALAALHPMDFDPDDKLTFSAGYGNYGGENAAAIGAYYRPDEKVMFSVGGTVGNGENMVNAGVSFSLDRTNHVSNSRTAMAREILDLRAEVTELKAMVAKGGLGSIAEDKMKIFPDVAENHWAYEYVGKLAAAGIIEGYPDGKFSGDRMMSRYEFAAMLYRAMQKGAQLDSKIINEFAPEMGRIRVDRISGEDGDRDKIERVRVNAVKGERDHYGNKLAK
ncbi:ESPR-type extended signal peptide-containing protein [Phascolarctobacterium succinatutens]|jgi:autotransporter adhesin|uniref:ESPR-type extended signal peptide-containing protein n=1 Tax=Phascolarctobacterium succinatutens TaxID=626940 RepID=UPI0026EC846B|nr:YadA-like family protein [Phascolarctobacterium succinatutens]